VFILFWLIVSRSKYVRFLQISNFEYLMELNTLAGRSYNDITQVNSQNAIGVLMSDKVNLSFNNLVYLCSILFSPG
jgi:hypothetical protein